MKKVLRTRFLIIGLIIISSLNVFSTFSSYELKEANNAQGLSIDPFPR
ncbi:hypothetical protein [Clostridium sp. 'White wine YQ']|nr:hypothetical protein [Clostridium sp. 'White wine YQ']MDD7795196.1 hypothetical protein [Clostridium sp. 'White wine YQ']